MGMPILRWLVRRIAFIFLRVDVRYTSDLLRAVDGGRVIVTANHVSFLDGLLFALVSPVSLAFAVEAEFARRNRLSVLGFRALSWMGFGSVVAVDGGAPFGMRALLRCLQSNQSVMIFPEGQISVSGAALPERPGVTWLASRSEAVVVRARISGVERSRFFGKSGREWWPRIRVDF